MKFFKKFLRSESGVAAIEFALIMPLLIFLFLGMADIVGYISVKQKATYAANAVGDLVAQFDKTITKSNATDIFVASEIMLSPQSVSRISDVTVEVTGYRPNASGAPVFKWSVSNRVNSSCNATPSTASLRPLMSAGNDIIVTQTCTTYKPIFLTFMGSGGPFSGITDVKSVNLSPPRTPNPLNYDANH